MRFDAMQDLKFLIIYYHVTVCMYPDAATAACGDKLEVKVGGVPGHENADDLPLCI
jgi:hypothetical protein